MSGIDQYFRDKEQKEAYYRYIDFIETYKKGIAAFISQGIIAGDSQQTLDHFMAEIIKQFVIKKATCKYIDDKMNYVPRTEEEVRELIENEK